MPVTVAASMLGHTTDVNERYYTFDTTSMDERAEMIERVNKATKIDFVQKSDARGVTFGVTSKS